MARLADMHPDVPWSYRPIFSFLAGQNPGSIFSLSAARADVLKADRADDRVDADELPVLKMPSREEIEADYAPGGLVNRMYPAYEPRDEQIAMALEVRDALVTGTHRVIEAGTGVGKSMAYLVPFAEAARRNNITVGIATKSNNLADQLMYHELPKLAEQLDGGLSFCALKGYDHYPCLRKLERMSRGQVEITTKRDPADTLTAVAVIMAYVCQSADGDLDSLGIRWRSVNRPDFTTASRECARRLCPFFPDKCLVHGARRRAAHADVVVTNHSLLFRNVAAEGRILPPIRHWVIDEAHSIEREARRQWARVVSADESRVLFERLGGSSTGALSQVSRDLATSEGSTLYLGLTAKATSTVARASMAIADVFDGVRELGRRARGVMTMPIYGLAPSCANLTTGMISYRRPTLPSTHWSKLTRASTRWCKPSPPTSPRLLSTWVISRAACTSWPRTSNSSLTAPMNTTCIRCRSIAGCVPAESQ